MRLNHTGTAPRDRDRDTPARGALDAPRIGITDMRVDHPKAPAAVGEDR